MNETKKKFEPFPVRTLRASNNTWKIFKSDKQKSGLSWDKFISNLKVK